MRGIECLGSNGVDRVRSLRKIPRRLHGTCALIAPVQPILHQVLCSNERLPNAPKHYETDQNKSLGSTWLDRVCSLRKILTRLRGTNFCTILARFAPSFVGQLNGPECTQIVRSASKCQFTVQWGGSNEFVAKNSDATLWHKFVHCLH